MKNVLIPIAAAEHAHQQHQHDRRAKRQLGAKRRQADRRRIAQQRGDKLRKTGGGFEQDHRGWFSMFRYASNSIVAGFARIQPRWQGSEFWRIPLRYGVLPSSFASSSLRHC